MSYAWGYLKRAFRRVAPIVALVLVFVVASAVGFVLHLGTTPGRRFVTRLTNSLVSEILVSDLRIERIEVLSPTTLRVSRVELVHHSGKPVLVAEGLEVHFGLLALLRGILGENEVRIAIPDVRVDRFSFALTRDVEKGGFTIESAFDTVPSKPSTTASKPVFVALPKMLVAAATVTTDQPGIEKTTARLTKLTAGLDLSPSGVVLALKTDDTKVTGLLARDVQSKLRSELRLPGTTRAELDARVGQVPVNAEFGMRGAELDIGVSSAELAPAALKDLLGSWPILVPLRVNARVKGEPSAMKATAQAELGTGRVSAAGSLVLVPEVSSKLDIHAEDLDLRAFDASAPQTALDVDATLTLRLARGFEMETTATFRESTVAGYAVPALKVHATYARDVLAGTATILDPKLASVVDFRVSGDGKVEFETKSADVDLAALARYGVAAKGRGAIRTKGALEGGHLAATFDASFRNADVGAARVESVSVRGSVSGPVSRPNELELEVEAQGTKLAVAGATLPRFRATVRGAGGRHAVSLVETSDKTPILDVSADVALGKQVVVSDVRLESRRGDDAIRVTVKRVEVDAGGVSVREISLKTAQGSASGSVTVQGRRRVVDLVVNALDVREAVSALGVSAPGVRGRLDGRVHFEEVGSERSGQVALELRDGGFPPYADVGAKLAVELQGSDIDTDAELTVLGVGEGKLEGHASLPRSLFDPRALRELVGNATFAFVGLDLEAASKPWLAESGVSLRGRATGSASVSRKQASDVPALSYRVKTDGLVVARASASGEGQQEIRLDVDSVGELLTAHGSRVALQLADGEGPWIAVALEHALSAEAFARAGKEGTVAAILAAPLRVDLKAYSRPLHVFGSGAASGFDRSVSAQVNVSGSARKPEIDASARVTGTGSTVAEREAGRFQIALRYSAERERYELEAHTVGDSDRIELSSEGRFGWLERGLGRDWSAKGKAKLERLRLAPLGRIVGVPFEGEASAHCEFDVESGKLEALGTLELERLMIDRHLLGSGSGSLKVKNGRAEAKLDIESAKSHVELVGDAGLAWSEAGPELDARQSGALRASVRNFELASVQPLVRGAASRISGKLNGHVELGWGAREGKGKPSTTLRANLAVTDGTASLAAGGGLIQRIDVQALAEPDGSLRITFSGAARSRKPNVKATAALRLDGPRLKRVDAKLELDKFPLIYDGVLMARATSGSRAPIEIGVVSADGGQTIDVHIPSVDIALPKTSSQSLIGLDDDGSIEVSDAPVDPEIARRAKQSTGGTTTLKVRLGKKVHIKQGNLDVPVLGSISVAPAGKMTGSITFPQGGVVPMLGQTFRIRRGAVTFKNQDVGEGTLAIQASTRASDGTVVDVNVSGKVQEPVIVLSSDPPRSEDEIVALLLGIQSDGEGTGENELGHVAMALAMNKLVEDSMLSGLQFGGGETSSGDSVSTVTMRVNSKVWFEGRTVRGSQTSVNPDERVSGVVDWRFAPSWSLRTQLGQVSGVELRWSLRY